MIVVDFPCLAVTHLPRSVCRGRSPASCRPQCHSGNSTLPLLSWPPGVSWRHSARQCRVQLSSKWSPLMQVREGAFSPWQRRLTST
ncbi:hypothetical protein JZ751_008857 [Albula glossodonta]|uniref:Uncharacterized protein n=1 Tax=Albula glossodonta TaxID=121402 RepID=A0A8T2NXE4_9TELE|nr:hypothetical protein JZ751_008857 [Albula glossodonta]